MDLLSTVSIYTKGIRQHMPLMLMPKNILYSLDDYNTMNQLMLEMCNNSNVVNIGIDNWENPTNVSIQIIVNDKSTYYYDVPVSFLERIKYEGIIMTYDRLNPEHKCNSYLWKVFIKHYNPPAQISHYCTKKDEKSKTIYFLNSSDMVLYYFIFND